MILPETYISYKGGLKMTPPEATEQAPLNILVIYDEIASAHRAMAVVSRLSNGIGEQVEFKPEFWRHDLLEEAEWRFAAAKDALQADVIIVSTREGAALGEQASAWLKECLLAREDPHLAMLTLHGSCQAWSISLRDAHRFHTAQQMGVHPEPRQMAYA